MISSLSLTFFFTNLNRFEQDLDDDLVRFVSLNVDSVDEKVEEKTE